MKESKYWEVKFKFKYPKNPGEDIRVIGNTESLGNWNLDLATKLYNNGNWITLENYLGITSQYN